MSALENAPILSEPLGGGAPPASPCIPPRGAVDRAIQDLFSGRVLLAQPSFLRVAYPLAFLPIT
jgi:hypothetical protein